MAPQQRFIAWAVLGLLILETVCSAREVRTEGFPFAVTRHTNFAKGSRFDEVEGLTKLPNDPQLRAVPGHGHHKTGGHHAPHSFSNKAAGNYITVSQTANANFNNIQAAVDSIPVNNNQWIEISIAAGVYREKVVIPFNKPFISLQGAGYTATMLTNSEAASLSGTANSATITVWAPNFIARGIGFQNAAPAAQPGAVNGQAVAVLLAGDMAAFYGCGFYGGQDTLFDYAGRHYFRDSYIEGTIDFIFGDAKSVFKNCEIHAIAQASFISGSLTAQKRSSPQEDTGFVFIDCKITGTGQVYLGRAWGAYSRTVYINTYMDNIIIPAGWQDWNNPQRQGTVYYGQYQCSGPGSNLANRVTWSHELSDGEASQFMQLSWIDGANWLQQV